MLTHNLFKKFIWSERNLSVAILLAAAVFATCPVASAQSANSNNNNTAELTNTQASPAVEGATQAVKTETVSEPRLQISQKKAKVITYRPHRRLSYRKFEDGTELWRKPDGTVRIIQPKGVGVASLDSQVTK